MPTAGWPGARRTTSWWWSWCPRAKRVLSVSLQRGHSAPRVGGVPRGEDAQPTLQVGPPTALLTWAVLKCHHGLFFAGAGIALALRLLGGALV